MPKKLGIVIAGLALFLLIGGGCTRTDAPADVSTDTDAPVEDTSPIKLGWLGPLTGDVSSVGTADREAAELAVTEINEAGGINGRMLEVTYEDGFCEGKTALAGGTKLINVDEVVAIVGGFCSGETLAVAPSAEEKHVVMLSPGSTAPSVTEAGDYIFRVVPSDGFQGKYAAEFVYNTLEKKKVAIVYAITDYAEGLANVFEEEYKKLGGEIVVKDSFLQEARDLKAQLTKVKNSEAEVLYFPTYTEAGVVGFKQAEELDLGIQILGPETLSDEKLVTAQGAEGTLYTVPVSNESEAFKTKFLEETGRDDMPVYASQTYDAVKILAQVIESVGTNGEDIKNELYNVKNYEGVSGMIGFDENGDLTSAEYKVMIIKDGKSEDYTK
ncbi:ABC transporter substrate-binding protein [Candidatus Parcubacteria bacterium]|nr:ABC transporter substrate-binding protein [Candidatus Parcubacteria bacterium]